LKGVVPCRIFLFLSFLLKLQALLPPPFCFPAGDDGFASVVFVGLLFWSLGCRGWFERKKLLKKK